MGGLSIWHVMLFGAVALLLFGGKGKISDIMGDVAKGIKSFKKGMADDDSEAKPAAVAGVPEHARVPVRPVRGQILRLRDPEGPGLLTRVVRFAGGYLVPRGDGRYVLGATVEERGFQAQPTAGGVYELLRDARELVPGVLELQIEELSVGFRPATPDTVPALGPGGVEGLVWATGHHRNGILLAPLTAELLADVLAGKPGDEDARTLLHGCDPARFPTSPPGAASTPIRPWMGSRPPVLLP